MKQKRGGTVTRGWKLWEEMEEWKGCGLQRPGQRLQKATSKTYQRRILSPFNITRCPKSLPSQEVGGLSNDDLCITNQPAVTIHLERVMQKTLAGRARSSTHAALLNFLNRLLLFVSNNKMKISLVFKNRQGIVR